MEAVNQTTPSTSGGIAIPDNRPSPAPLGTNEIPMHEDPAFRGGGKCQFCPQKLTRGSSLKRHYTIHINTPLPNAQDREILADILQRKHYTYHICLICEFFYNRFCDLQSHVDRHEVNADIPATWRNPDGSDDKYGPLFGRKLTANDRQSILEGVKREGLRYRSIAGAKSLKRKREEEETGAVGCDQALDASGSQPRCVEADNTEGLPSAMSRNILQGGGASTPQGSSGSQDSGSGGKEGNLQETDGLTDNVVSSSPSPLASRRKKQESSA